jgi:hypothetical protein
LTFSMDADEEKHILYEKTEVLQISIFFMFLKICISIRRGYLD